MVKISPTSNRNGTFVLLEEYSYKDVVVPVDFETNGMDLKFQAFSLFVHRYDPRCLEAVIVHDYLCELEEYEKADEYFEELLPEIWQKKFMIFFVKMYHSVKYR